MIAAGCLSLVVLPLIGMAAGGWLAGSGGAAWGAGIGFALALALCGLSGLALVKARRG
ncbi:hypothetical protein [Sphingomonas sp. CLY1604]|uniref:hypothetical protein n=1 Tax=Sphingomonas sp. CLY1604 TaxID=3457786 RepID=UPI003FD76188